MSPAVGELLRTRKVACGSHVVLELPPTRILALGSAVGGGPASGESAVEVGPEVFDVLAADAEPQQRGWQVLLAGDGGATLDRGLDGAETRGVPDDLHAFTDGVRTRRVARGRRKRSWPRSCA